MFLKISIKSDWLRRKLHVMLGKNSGVTCRSLRLDVLRCLVSLFLEQAFFLYSAYSHKNFILFQQIFFVLSSIVYSFLWLIGDTRARRPKLSWLVWLKPVVSQQNTLAENIYLIMILWLHWVLKYLLVLLLTHFYQVTGDYVFPCPSSFSSRDNIAPTWSQSSPLSR